MLTPEQLKEIPDYFVNLYQELEQFVIADFARRVEKSGSITDTAEWQAIRAQEIGMSMSELEKEIKRVTELSQSEIDALMKGVAELSLRNDAPLYEQMGKLAPNLERSETLQNYVKAAQDQTKGELFNMTQSLGFARKVGNKIEYLPMFEFYNKALDLAQFQVSTGVLDYNTATRNAVKQIAQSGLRWVDYESGWHNRVDVAARRAIMTGVNQMSSKFNDQVVDDLAADYVEVTAHSGARPDHMSWQGKVFKIRGSSKGYPNLAAVTGLGTGPGLCGWNCAHNYYAFFPGISVRTWSDKELKNIDPPPFEYEGKSYTHYEAKQKQRQIETAMRQSKNELIGYDAIGDKTAFTTTSIKLQRQKEFYKDFSKAADLPYQNERHQVLKFDRSVSQKSAWANKKIAVQANKVYNLDNENANIKAYLNYLNQPFLQEKLNYLFDEPIFDSGVEKNFIPRFTVFEKNSVKTISSGSEIRVVSTLMKKYGGTENVWTKQVGKIKSDKYIFDLHWYEKENKQHEMKLKMRKERK